MSSDLGITSGTETATFGGTPNTDRSGMSDAAGFTRPSEPIPLLGLGDASDGSQDRSLGSYTGAEDSEMDVVMQSLVDPSAPTHLKRGHSFGEAILEESADHMAAHEEYVNGLIH